MEGRNYKRVSYVYMIKQGHKSSRDGKSNHMASRSVADVDVVALEEKSDEALITIFQNGERHVFRVLVERYHGRIRNLVYSIFHEQEIVEDIAQEVFIKAYEALPHFRFEASFYTWLYRIAVNKSRDELRKRKVRRMFSLQTMLDSSDKEFHAKITVHPEDREAQELIAAGLQALPEKFRLPVVLKDIDGLSYEEIAEVMQCEIGTVKSRLSRARAMLRELLKPLLKDNT